jgi:hypothetical protein
VAVAGIGHADATGEIEDHSAICGVNVAAFNVVDDNICLMRLNGGKVLKIFFAICRLN